jgi:hypothetical protein
MRHKEDIGHVHIRPVPVTAIRVYVCKQILKTAHK